MSELDLGGSTPSGDARATRCGRRSGLDAAGTGHPGKAGTGRRRRRRAGRRPDRAPGQGFGIRRPLAALDSRSPEFTQKVASITSMGTSEMRAGGCRQPHPRTPRGDGTQREGRQWRRCSDARREHPLRSAQHGDRTRPRAGRTDRRQEAAAVHPSATRSIATSRNTKRRKHI